MAKPASLSWEEAASVALTFLVSYDMLVLQGRLQPGEWVLINGVSSGVGVASLQLAKVLGAKVIGTSGSAGQAGAAEGLWAWMSRSARARPISAPAVMQATEQHGADLVINTVGGTRLRREHPRHGLRRPARHRGLCRWRGACRPRPGGPARQAAHAVRRVEQAAQQGAAGGRGAAPSWPRCCRTSRPAASGRRSTGSATSRS